MRDETAAWLAPMLDEIGKRGIDIKPLMMQASMPAAEAYIPVFDLMARDCPPGVVRAAVDWVRFGELLCEELGWDVVYPQHWLATDGADAMDGISGGAEE